MAWLLFFTFIFMVSSPLLLAWLFWLTDKKTYKVVWRYDRMCYPSTTLVKARSPYDAWHKVEKQHAISIELIEVSKYV